MEEKKELLLTQSIDIDGRPARLTMVSLAKTTRSPKKNTSIGMRSKNKSVKTEGKSNTASSRKKKERKFGTCMIFNII